MVELKSSIKSQALKTGNNPSLLPTCGCNEDLIRSNGSDKQTDKWKNYGRTLPILLSPCYTVNTYTVNKSLLTTACLGLCCLYWTTSIGLVGQLQYAYFGDYNRLLLDCYNNFVLDCYSRRVVDVVGRRVGLLQ